MAVLFPSGSSVRVPQFSRPELHGPHFSQQKNRSLRRAKSALRQSGGVACRPVVGPLAPQTRGTDRSLLYKRRAKSLAPEKRCAINAKKLIAEIGGSAACRRLAHSRHQSAKSLCSAKN
jgi:hypothetical protein